ncbi:MAG: hypothetical protein HY514_01215 [Candidatus Aenigmarchaeota archaeon]|nr:hypothetical protein [Candidatus Aenigmarchaeota archaeon]
MRKLTISASCLLAETERSREVARVHNYLKQFMKDLGYPRDTKHSTATNPTYCALQATGELLTNLMEIHQGRELTVYVTGNRYRVGIYLRLPVKDDFDHAARGKEIASRIAANTGKEFLAYIQENQRRDAETGRTGHAGIGCFAAEYFSDGLKTRSWSNNGQEGTEIFILIKRK